MLKSEFELLAGRNVTDDMKKPIELISGTVENWR